MRISLKRSTTASKQHDAVGLSLSPFSLSFSLSQEQMCICLDDSGVYVLCIYWNVYTNGNTSRLLSSSFLTSRLLTTHIFLAT
eukprot:m.452925 g.452925  ORF g.452925 m.452925 type:complete len:83 (-) comp20411_c0_seq1:22-270(-)